MRNLKKRIISLFLVLVITLSVLPAEMGVDTVKAAGESGSLTFQYRWGNSNTIQVNTNLPTSTPLVDFTTGQNGCSIDESGNTVQWVGWISMANADGTIVLTFNFNSAFTSGQTYVLPKGAVFGFTDGSSYTLDGDYTFTFDGSNWSMDVQNVAVIPEELSFEYRYGTSNLIQVNTNLPSSTPCASFLATDNGCNLIQSGDQQLGWAGMDNVDGTIVITFHFNDEFSSGQTYTLGENSVFGFTDGSSYPLDGNYVFTFNGSSWSYETIEYVNAEATLTPSGVYGTVIQFGSFYNFSVPTDNTKFDFEGSVKVDSVEIYDNIDFWFGGYVGTDTISFNCNKDFVNKLLTIEKGTVLSYNNTYVTITKTFNGIWDGSAWTMVPVMVAEKELVKGYTADTLVQFTGFYDFGVSSDNTPLTFDGTVMLDGEIVENPSFVGYPNNTTICLNSISHKDKVLTITAGSIVSYDGIGVKISKTFNMKYDGSSWTEIESIFSNVEGDTNGDFCVDSMDIIRIKKVVDETKVANNQCDPDSNGRYSSVDAHYLRLVILYGSIDALDVLDPLLYKGGDEFITFADIPVDASDTSKIEEFKALGFNTSILTEDYVGSPTNDLQAIVVRGEPIAVSGNVLTLEYAGFYSNNTLQLKTELPTSGTYDNFLNNTSGYSVKESGSQVAGWFEMLNNGEYVYFTPHFNNAMSVGDTYVLEAGSVFTFNSTEYVLDRTYTFTFTNTYFNALENLDNAGLNVWIRNHSNTADYFTDELTVALKKYEDVIDGFYMVDEPFMTEALYEYSKDKYDSSETTVSFDEGLTTLYSWFNNNFTNKYFHVNHVPISSYNHYGTAGDSEVSAEKYKSFLNTYATDILGQVDTTSEKKTIGYDNYPFGYTVSESGTILGFIPTTTVNAVTEGIIPNYLVNMLVAANVAKENKSTFSYCVQTFNHVIKKPGTDTVLDTRNITTAAEVSFQLYTGMACGADQFEYFVYNSNSSFEGIMNSDGTGRIYEQVKEANTNAFCFADVINTFDWQGLVTSKGTDSKNAEAIDSAASYVASENGVLNSVSSEHDAVVGYYAFGSQDGYMIANYNDPTVVTGNNKVTLSFEGCTRARVYTAVAGKLTSEEVALDNGLYTCEVLPGGGFFIIPA